MIKIGKLVLEIRILNLGFVWDLVFGIWIFFWILDFEFWI